jgi:[lysine-biosynthesis-protein LysW]--L-2-aminoadipate ligase
VHVFVAGASTLTNRALARALEAAGARAMLLPVEDVARRACLHDAVLARVDVAATLDGTEPGLSEVAALEGRGVAVLNRADALVAAHDKLLTARCLAGRDVPHPRSVHVDGAGADVPLHGPVVVKPRFGSWGRDVHLCRSRAELRTCLETLARRPWFRVHGALVQELVPPTGEDLRVLVADGEVAGAIRRVAAPGEWRTNVALGGRRVAACPPAEAEAVALAAARAVGGDLVGVDLLPAPGGWVVLELNGCVDFTAEYALTRDADVFAAVARRLVRLAGRRAETLAPAELPVAAAVAG